MKIDFYNISNDIEQKPFKSVSDKNTLVDGEALPDDIIPTPSRVLPKTEVAHKKQKKKSKPSQKTKQNSNQNRNSIIAILLIVVAVAIWFNLDKIKSFAKANVKENNKELTVLDSLRLADSLEKAIGTATLGDEAFNELMPVTDSIDKLSDKVLDSSESNFKKTKKKKVHKTTKPIPRLIHNQFSFVSAILCNVTKAQELSLKLHPKTLNLSFKGLFKSDILQDVLDSSFESYPKIKERGSSTSVKGDVTFKKMIISPNEQLFELVDILDAFILTHENNLQSIDIPISDDQTTQRVTLIFEGTQLEICSMVNSWSMINANLTIVSMKIRGDKNNLKMTLIFEFKE